MSEDIECYCWHEKPYGPGPYCMGCGGLIKRDKHVESVMKNEISVKDRYDKQLTIGNKVAFNCSGEAAIGFITDIKRTERYGKKTDWNGNPYYIFSVRHQGGNRISKVTSRMNLVNI